MVCGICRVRWISQATPRAATGPSTTRVTSSVRESCPERGEGRRPLVGGGQEQDGRNADDELHDQSEDEEAVHALQRLDREPEVDQVPVAEQHAGGDRPERQGSRQESQRVEQGSRAERWSQPEA